MAGREQPQVPNPMDVSRDHLDLNRFSQSTPFGTQAWHGNTLHTTLNPQDQQRLQQHRQLQSGLLSAVLGGGGDTGGGKPPSQGAPMPPMQGADPPPGGPPMNPMAR